MLLGSLSNEDDYDSIENVAKRMRFASFQTSSRLFAPAQQLYAIFPEVKFLRTSSRFKKTKENSSSYFHLRH